MKNYMRIIRYVDQENVPYTFLVLYRNSDNWDFNKITDQYGDMIITQLMIYHHKEN